VLTNGREQSEAFVLQAPQAVARTNGSRKSRPPVKAKPAKKPAKRKK